MALIRLPYTNLHELNLDWIIQNLKEAGVLSVNGETGIVVLYRDANVQLPDTPNDLNWSIKRKVNGTDEGIKFNKSAPMQRVHGSNAFLVYDEGNPPPYPVTSVNGSTGAVTVQVPFESLASDLISFATNSPEHSWTLNRKTRDGDIMITLDSTSDVATIKLEYISDDESVETSQRLLTETDLTTINTNINNINNLLATSYYDIPNIGVIRFVGKLAIIDFINQLGQVPSTGLQLPYTFVDDIRTICQYYNGTTNVIGELHINKNGSVYVRSSGVYIDATYVLGQAVAYLAT